jgi:hypothetical protein
MGTVAGHSAGFGRIGAETRPSAYTPFHLSSAPRPSPPPVSGQRVRTRTWVALGVALVAAVATAALSGLFVKAPPTAQSLDSAAKRIQILDPEAERLGRSAFARQRHRG